MKVLLLAAALLSAGTVYANELDREQANIAQRATELPATVVVRVDTRDNTAAVLHSNTVLGAADAQAVVAANFTAVDAAKSELESELELDKDSSKSGWYFYFNYGYYSFPTYFYYNYSYSYRPYYAYNYRYYNYYYYRW